MTVEKFAEKFGYEVLCMPEPEKEIENGYAGDLLSWVMGRANAGDAWVTIMSNVNIVAVATLADPCCIVLSEGVEPDADALSKAESMGINILGSEKDTFSLCADIASII